MARHLCWFQEPQVGSSNSRDYDNILLTCIAYLGANLVTHGTVMTFQFVPSKQSKEISSNPLAVLSEQLVFYKVWLTVVVIGITLALLYIVRYYFFFDWIQASGITTYEYQMRARKTRGISESFEGNRSLTWNKIMPFLEKGTIIVNPQWEAKHSCTSPGKWKILKQNALFKKARGGQKQTVVSSFLQELGVGTRNNVASGVHPLKRALKPDLPPKLPAGFEQIKPAAGGGDLDSDRLPSSLHQAPSLRQSSEVFSQPKKDNHFLPPLQKSKFSKESAEARPQKNNFFNRISEEGNEGSVHQFGRIEFANDHNSVVKMLRQDSDVEKRVRRSDSDLPGTEPMKMKKLKEKKILRGALQ